MEGEKKKSGEVQNIINDAVLEQPERFGFWSMPGAIQNNI